MFPRRGAQRAAEMLYVEDVFSAFTYDGTGLPKTIVNGIDLSEHGGMVWIKRRATTTNHAIYDTARGVNQRLSSNLTSSQVTETQGLTAFNSDGFTVDALTAVYGPSTEAWTFRKAPKFFDIVTYTGNGVAGRQIAHDLGVAPGMIIIKCLNNTGTENGWLVWHRSLAAGNWLQLNTSSASIPTNSPFSNVDATMFRLTFGSTTHANVNGATYVAYLFAHDDSEDGIIQCGSFAANSSGDATVDLGWEPQFLLTKCVTAAQNWSLLDTARGWDLSASDKEAFPNSTSAEVGSTRGNPTATGFDFKAPSVSQTYVYMAIRKGLMRPPTDPTKVFAINARNGTGAAANVTAGSITAGPDLFFGRRRDGTGIHIWENRLIGAGSYHTSTSNAAEVTGDTLFVTAFNMDSVSISTGSALNNAAGTFINCFVKQARGFFDHVGYVGTGVAKTESHNLGVAPELILVKDRTNINNWIVYAAALGAGNHLRLDLTNALTSSATMWNGTDPTANVFSVGTATQTNGSGANFIAYLFASCPGVSKIGTYSGTGAAQQINCGFAAGARFVLIKRVDSTGDWYFWDSTRGIVSGNDPYLLMNSIAIEVTSTDYIDPYSAGFEISSTAPAAINASGGTFLYFAIA